MARKPSELKLWHRMDWPSQSPQRPSRLGDQLYEQMLDRIVTGSMVEGAKLPSESQLSEIYGVSRPVVREALSRLQADGVVVSRHGSGSFVKHRPNQALSLLAPIGDVVDLVRCMEFRVAMEGEAAYLAAMRRSEADLDRIKRAFDDLERVIASDEVGGEADQAFHIAIAAATQNRLFLHAMDVFGEHTLRGIELARKLSLRRSARRLQMVQMEHLRVLKAIESEEAEEAREAMRTHIDNARIRVLTDSTEP